MLNALVREQSIISNWFELGSIDNYNHTTLINARMARYIEDEPIYAAPCLSYIPRDGLEKKTNQNLSSLIPIEGWRFLIDCSNVKYLVL